MESFRKRLIQVSFPFVLLVQSTFAQYHNASFARHPVSLIRAGNEVWCGGRLCGSSNEMQCCSFDPSNCCNKNNQYCGQVSCGMIQDGWYCGDCGSFDGNSCCNDELTICESQVCGLKEDYTCCDSKLHCCTIIPPEPEPTPFYALWWFWVGLIFCLTLVFFIGFVLWSDRHFIKYNIDKARGLNPQPPPGMPFHRRASTRIRSSFRESRQAVHRASVRVSQRRRKPRPGPSTDTGTSADRPEVTHITGPPPFVNGPRSLRSYPPQPPSNPQSEPPPPYSAEPSGAEASVPPAVRDNRAGPSRDPTYGKPTGERKLYPPISPSHDLTPMSEVKRYAPSGGPQRALRKELTQNPPFNPDYDPSKPAIFSQQKSSSPQNSPYSGGGHPLEQRGGPPPQHFRDPPPQGYGYPRGPPPQGLRGPISQAPRRPPPQNPRETSPQTFRGPQTTHPRGPQPPYPSVPQPPYPPQTFRGPQPTYPRVPQPTYSREPQPPYSRGPPSDNRNYPTGPHAQGPGYAGSPRNTVPSNRERAPMPPGFGNSHGHVNDINETII